MSPLSQPHLGRSVLADTPMLAELKNQPEAIKKFLQVCLGFRNMSVSLLCCEQGTTMSLAIFFPKKKYSEN
jgi:hypothetical protein